MSEDADMSFDIDALFEHLLNDLDHKIEDEQDWTFSLRSKDLSILEVVAGELEELFLVDLYETVEEEDEEGNVSIGGPLLVIIHRGALTAEEVKAIAAEMSSIADQHDLVYEGVDCFDPVDVEELLAWIPVEDIGERMQSMTDSGLPADSELPWSFLVLTTDGESLTVIAAEFEAAGFTDRDEYEEPDEEGEYGLCVFVVGRNNEAELLAAAGTISAISQKHGARLEGVQFFTREDMEEDEEYDEDEEHDVDEDTEAGGEEE